MPNVLMVFPRFNQHSFWNLQAVCDTYGVARAVSAARPDHGGRAAAAPTGTSGSSTATRTTLQRRRSRVGRHGDDRRHAAAAAPTPSRIIELRTGARQAGGGRRPGRDVEPRRSTRRPTSACSARPRADRASSSRRGSAGERRRHLRGREVQGRRDDEPGAALRPARVQPLPPHRRAVLARLPVQLRVLRHHRAVRPRAAHQDQRRRCWPSSRRSTRSAIAATSTSSTTTSSATRRR